MHYHLIIVDLVKTKMQQETLVSLIFFNPDFGTYHNISDYDDDNDVMFRRIVKYPMDMQQYDHMFIQCYGYNPPYRCFTP